MRDPEVTAFIRKNDHLFWCIPDCKKEDINDETLVEFILKYGALNSLRELPNLFGIDKTADNFNKTFNLSWLSKNNYTVLTLNFLSLFLINMHI